jgi:hypothetical protein
LVVPDSAKTWHCCFTPHHPCAAYRWQILNPSQKRKEKISLTVCIKTTKAMVKKATLKGTYRLYVTSRKVVGSTPIRLIFFFSVYQKQKNNVSGE